MRYLLLVTSAASLIATMIQTYNYTVVRHELEVMEMQRDKWRSAAVKIATAQHGICNQSGYGVDLVPLGDIPCRGDQGLGLEPLAPNVEGRKGE